MKNVNVDASIIHQVLQYAFWAETNPDSIKSLWLECKNKPEDISISWDKVQVRIIILAPSILRSTLDIVDKISYPVDLIEVKRWMEKDNQFILVNQLEREITTKHIKPIGGLKQYNEAFYREEYNRQSAGEFIRVTNEIGKLVKKQGWSLEKKYNKHYCGYKAGFFNAFGVQWVGSKTFALFFKLPEKEAKGLNPRMTKYQSLWKQALYYIEPKKFRINDYLGLFKAAYKHLTSE